MAWTQTGNLKGPKGDTGAQGPAGPKGDPGEQGPIGPQGPQGPAGVDGKGVEIAGQVPTYEALPTGLTAEDAGKGYLVEADGDLYVWTGSAFPAKGSGANFQGPAGPEGPQGPAGAQGIQGVKGDTGAQGPRGTKWFTGAGTPTTVAGAVAGDMYLDTTSGTTYVLA